MTLEREPILQFHDAVMRAIGFAHKYDSSRLEDIKNLCYSVEKKRGTVRAINNIQSMLDYWDSALAKITDKTERTGELNTLITEAETDLENIK